MSASTPAGLEGVPVLGPVVARDRIISLLRTLSPSNIFILGPAGYGKTFLAAQICQSRPHVALVWVECGEGAVSGSAMLERVAEGLAAWPVPQTSSDLNSAVSAADEGLLDVAVRVRLALSRLAPGGVCVVLDALRLDDALCALEGLAADISRVPEAMLVVTARDIPEDGYSYLSRFHFIEPDELRFDSDETARLVDLIWGGGATEAMIDAILEASGGQAALASVLARHCCSRGVSEAWSVPASADLRSLLIGLAGRQLGHTEREILFILGVLGSATLSELRALRPDTDIQSLREIAQTIPLVRFEEGQLGLCATVRMHAVAQSIYSSRQYTSGLNSDVAELMEDCVHLLEQRGDFERALQRLASRQGEDNRLVEWLEQHSSQAVAQGARLAVSEAISGLPTTVLLEHPKLLAIGASLEADLALVESALTKASAARDIARSNGDLSLEVESALVMARVLIAQCRLEEALECLEAASGIPQPEPFADSRAVALSYLIAHAGVQLDQRRVEAATQALAEVMTSGAPSAATRGISLSCRAGASVMFGDFHKAVSLYADVLELHPLAIELRATAMSNRATVFVELGKVELAIQLAEKGSAYADGYGLSSHVEACACARAAAEFASDGAPGSLHTLEAALERFCGARDRTSEDFTRMYLAVMYRAAGRVSASMVHVDHSLEHAVAKGIEYFRALAEAEMAANLLALGDVKAAAQLATSVRGRCAAAGANYHLIRADMVLAEVARREGRDKEARGRLIDHESYILSENPNWSIAMYIRAFPHLLGLFAGALGAGRLPAHMLSMITGHHIDVALSAARKMLEEDEWQELAYRMLGEGGADRIAALSATAPCRVRLFGGLEVSVGTHQVLERDWRKRKARLLFAMLVLEQGREVPRDRIYDHLWPEMDDERARNNLYVIWSSMKGALVPGTPKGAPCPYVEHSGGVCKVVPEHVFSDVAEFDSLVSAARQAEAAGDVTGAVQNYERLMDIYRGDLLPGDVYDDWFAQARDRYRQEFCDSMLTAHRLMSADGDHPGALRLVRRAITMDPWREDLYQAALRSQIESGQRSAAIDTYLSCRANLADQLGLDPSAETLRLYEQVLAMEESPQPNP